MKEFPLEGGSQAGQQKQVSWRSKKIQGSSRTKCVS